MNVFRKYILDAGVRPGQSGTIRNRIRLLNQFNLITLFIMAGGILNLILLRDYHSMPVLLGGVSLQLFGTYLNRRSLPDISASCLLLSINSLIFYYGSYFGPGSGIFFFYFPAALCIAYLFDFLKQKIYFVCHFLLLFLFITILLIYDFKPIKGPGFTSANIEQIFAFDLFICVLLILYFIYLVNRTNDKRQKELLQYIEDQKLAEESTKAALREKETLLAEVHHRVKNNLAVISGLLNLQMHTVTNQYTRDVLLDCKTRVASMALVHEKLYRSHSLAEIDLHSYLPDLINEIRNSFLDSGEHIKVDLSIPHVFMTVSEAIPCGLILNELITNAFKHAFGEQKNAEIQISIRRQDKELLLDVSDNGKGMPAEIQPEKAETLGLILIQSLVDQLGGKYTFKNNNGTQFSLIFTSLNSHIYN
jgi:two-component sensor histidine kinase